MFIKNKYKGDNSVTKKTKRGFPIKRSGLDVLMQIILLNGFDVCISIVRLSRYEIQIILLHGFDVCISLVRLNKYAIKTILTCLYPVMGKDKLDERGISLPLLHRQLLPISLCYTSGEALVGTRNRSSYV